MDSATIQDFKDFREATKLDLNKLVKEYEYLTEHKKRIALKMINEFKDLIKKLNKIIKQKESLNHL